MLTRMYDRDPRAHWHPRLAELYRLQPWEMLDLTPVELDAIIDDLKLKARSG